MGEITALDAICVGLLALAAVRGLWIGLVREAASLAALGAALLAIRVGTDPLALRVLGWSDGALSPAVARGLAGAALAVAAITVVAIAGRLVRRGLRAAGLGLADRLAGGLLGAGEGALVVGVLLLALLSLLGAEHPALADSRSVEIFESLEQLAGGGPLAVRDVAAPPR